MLVSYIPEINKKLCDSLGIDVLEAHNYLNNENLEDIEETYQSVSVVISAAVTA